MKLRDYKFFSWTNTTKDYKGQFKVRETCWSVKTKYSTHNTTKVRNKLNHTKNEIKSSSIEYNLESKVGITKKEVFKGRDALMKENWKRKVSSLRDLIHRPCEKSWINATKTFINLTRLWINGTKILFVNLTGLWINKNKNEATDEDVSYLEYRTRKHVLSCAFPFLRLFVNQLSVIGDRRITPFIHYVL